jgi:uncharacterized protein (DUF2384 family)
MPSLEQNIGADRDLPLRTLPISVQTLARRRIEETTSPEESNRALRLARIWAAVSRPTAAPPNARKFGPGQRLPGV